MFLFRTSRLSSLAGPESDVRVVPETRFSDDEHDSIDLFGCPGLLAYFSFDARDRYTGSTRDEMDTPVRVFVLQELHGWSHEPALVGYRIHRPELCERLGFETIPDQLTLWRSWHERSTADLCESVETAARTTVTNAQNAGVAVPREQRCRRVRSPADGRPGANRGDGEAER